MTDTHGPGSSGPDETPAWGVPGSSPDGQEGGRPADAPGSRPPEAPRYGPPPPQYGAPPGAPGPGAAPGPGPHPGWQQGVPPAQWTSWQGNAPEDLMRLHKPGIIPLRPLTLGEIFDGALQTMRRNPESTIGLALIVLTVFLLPTIGLGLAAQNLNVATQDAQLVLGLLPQLGALLATLALSGLIIFVVSEAVLGERAGMGQTWRAVRSRIPALIGVSLLSLLIYGVAFVALMVLVVVLVLALAEVGGLLSVLFLLLAIPAALWLVARLALASAAVVLERSGPIAALGRSWQLTRGGQAWRIAGILLLSWIVVFLFSLVIATPLSFGALWGLEQTGLDVSTTSVTSVLVSNGIGLLVDSIVTPFTAGVTALLYLDQRMRRESLDISLLHAAQARAAERRT